MKRLRQAQREHAAKIRDVGFLPEGEIHSRSQGSTPYDMGHDDQKYPFQRIFDAAELASSLQADAVPALIKGLGNADSAVRYWSALGLLMRGTNGTQAGNAQLTAALKDASPYVRIVAAQSLAQYGGEDALPSSLAVLGELAPVDKSGVFVSMAALAAIDALGSKACAATKHGSHHEPRWPFARRATSIRTSRVSWRILRPISGGPAAVPPPGKAKKAKKAKAKANP